MIKGIQFPNARLYMEEIIIYTIIIIIFFIKQPSLNKNLIIVIENSFFHLIAAGLPVKGNTTI